MLKSVEIKNFRCLQSVEVPLRPLTVLIGANDSGKSAFLAAMLRLGCNVGFSESDYLRLNTDNPIFISGRTDVFRVERTPQGGIRYTPGAPAEVTIPASLYYLPSTGVGMAGSGYSDQKGPPEIGSAGENLPALLDYLLRRDRERFFAFVDAMRGLVPGLKEVEIATPDPSKRRVDLVVERGLRLPADQASAGVRLLVFFVALAYHPSPPKLILLEEPENGVHPKRLGDVMRLLREVSQGVHGDHAAQIILTTHSPHLLDYVDLTQDQVLVFHRNEDGSRGAQPVDAERLKTFLDEFMLGEVWYNEGEAGLTGKHE
jgi:predicted ATPase